MRKILLFSFVCLSGKLLFANSFTDEHDSTQSYTHPSFVVYNDEPYRTLKSVPADTSITNTEYWSNLKTEATQQELPSGSESPPETDTTVLATQVPGNETPLAPPSFTSGTSVDFTENASGTVYTAVATGAESYSISGGDDSSKFTINTATGAVTFTTSPDYENPTDQGTDNAYSLTITATNTGGSAELSLTVTVTDDTSDNPSTASNSRLINLSTRAYVGPKDQFQEMVGGFGITGSGSVKLFVRGYGPHLAQFFGAGALSDPKVTIKTFPGGDVVLENLEWNPNDPEWSEIGDEYKPSTSGDCAAFITVEPGLYTTEVVGENGANGIGMIEIFTYDDLTAKIGGTVGNGSASLSKLMNLSTRSFVGLKSEFQEMVGGFGVSGTDPLKLFVRSYGPHLAVFFGDGALSNPSVSIKSFPAGEVVLENENWDQSDAEWNIVADEYKPTTSGDSAAFITVDPGLFTTEVIGVNGVTGLGMIEIFTYEELNKK